MRNYECLNSTRQVLIRKKSIKKSKNCMILPKNIEFDINTI